MLTSTQQLSTVSAIQTTGPCSLCLNGEAITLPEKNIALQGFEFIENCQALSALVPALFQQPSDECTLLQSIGTLCGCPLKKDACNLCSDGSKVQYGWRELGFLAETFGGIVPTCEIAEAGLHSYNSTDGYCSGSQLLLSDYCGCGAKPGSQPVVLEDSQRCTLCPLGETVPLSNKTVEIVGFPFQTCGQLAKATQTLFEDKPLSNSIASTVDNSCLLMRQLSVHCGCKPLYDKPCPICKIGNSFSLDGYTNESYWLYILFSVLTPIQGFLNSCIYFRRRIMKWVGCGQKNKRNNDTISLCQSATNVLIWPIMALWRMILWKSDTSAGTDSPNSPRRVALSGSNNVQNTSSGNAFQPNAITTTKGLGNGMHSTSEQEEKMEEESLQDAVSLVPFSSQISQHVAEGGMDNDQDAYDSQL